LIDTNVLISAFGFGGNPRRVIETVLDGRFHLILPEKQWIEIQRVLDYPRLRFSEKEKHSIKLILEQISTFEKVSLELSEIPEDPSDNMFLEAAKEFSIPLLISGDKHLLKIAYFEGTRIITPTQFLREIDEGTLG